MSFDAVVFDLFGTLVDYFPESYYQHSYEMTAKALLAPVDEFKEAWKSTRSDRDLGRLGSLENDITSTCRLLGIEPAPAQIKEAAQIRLDTYCRNLEPRAGAIETLMELRSRGHKIGLISVCASETSHLWPDSQLAELVDAAVFSCEEGLTKPDPLIYLRACEMLHTLPEKCLYIGDGSYDELAGAERVGMHSVLIYMGYNGGQDYLSPEAGNWTGPVVKSLSDILQMT